MFPASTDAPHDAPLLTPGGRAPEADLSPSTVLAVRRVLHARREGCDPASSLRAAAGLVVVDARRRGLSPEAMLVAVKRTWAGLDDARDLSGHDGQALLDRLVTLGISGYFADRATPPTAESPAADGDGAA